jgi:hypothetical protein
MWFHPVHRWGNPDIPEAAENERLTKNARHITADEKLMHVYITTNHTHEVL